ncbi:MAG: hypothetical protein LKI93_04000 [Bifidobacteriaceae bacterium]|jgi:signal transduction histidine kinase|nr:hypothetical protein [Bifidobacteriaceae bacterium]MCI1914765.1 hypothetical protein [Bifidobacteriaceae bacterium]
MDEESGEMVNMIRAIQVNRANRSSGWGWLMHRRGIILGEMVALILTIIEIAEVRTWEVQDVVDAVIQCGLIVLVVLFPRTCSVGIIAQYVVTSLYPHEYAISGLYGLWLALVLVGYFFPAVISSILFLIAPMALAVSTFFSPTNNLNPEGKIGLSSFFFGFYFLGLIFRRHEIKQKNQGEAARTKLIEQENLRLKRDNILAIELHDSLAGGLSSIALRSEMRKDDDKDFKEIHLNSLDLLNEVHKILDILAQPEVGHVIGRQQKSVKSTAVALESLLHSHGFSGSISVNVRESEINPELVSFVNNLLGELTRNIERYSSPVLGEYAISVRFGEESIQIRATNPVSTEYQTKNGFFKFRTGKGLMLYSRRAESLNGSLTYGINGDSWFLSAVLPLES